MQAEAAPRMSLLPILRDVQEAVVTAYFQSIETYTIQKPSGRIV